MTLMCFSCIRSVLITLTQCSNTDSTLSQWPNTLQDKLLYGPIRRSTPLWLEINDYYLLLTLASPIV